MSDQLRNEVLQPVVACSPRKNQQGQDSRLAWLQLQDFGHEFVHTDRAVLYCRVVSESQFREITPSAVIEALRVGNLVLNLCER